MKRALLALFVVLGACQDPAAPAGMKHGDGGQLTTGGLTKVSHDSTLSGNGTVSSNLGVNTSNIQNRVTGTCTAPNAVTVVNSDGTVTCTSNVQQRVTGTCSSPNAVATVNSDGTVVCTTGVLNTSNVSGTNGDLTAFTGTNTVGNYAGSSPSACSAGQYVSNEALSAAGALTHSCTAISVTCAELPALTGDVTSSAGSCGTSLGANVVSNSGIRQSAADSVIGNSTGSTANVADISASSDGQVLQQSNGTLQWLGMTYGGIFGDGSDGNVHLTSGTTTLTRDEYYDTLTMDDGAVIKTAGFRVYIRTKLIGPSTQSSGGAIIQMNGGNGGNASGTTPGTGASNLTSGSIYTASGSSPCSGATANSSGGNQGTVNPASASWPNNFTAGTGGTGGNGSVSHTGGTGASSTISAASVGTNQELYRALNSLLLSPGAAPKSVFGGGWGGPGAGETNVAGGGCGMGGGYVAVAAMTVTNASNVFIEANGGNGGNGATNVNGSGGGGGGGGGYAVLALGYKTAGTAPTLQANGGNGGTGGTGAGAPGAAGAGKTLLFVLSN